MTDDQETDHITRQAAALDDPRLCRDSGGVTDAQDEAPERIWADRSPFGEHSWMDVEYDGGTLYVRADLARPSQAGDERVAEGIAIALWREEAAPGTPSVQKLRNADTWVDQAPELRDRWMRFARAALAAMDTPKGGGDE